MKKLFISILFFASAIGTARAFSLSNFEVPESIVVDYETGTYYVSNINGAPTEKDANGYISKIEPNGGVVIQKFIASKADEPLHAPKGLAIVGKTLYVSDIDAVKGYDKETGKKVYELDFLSYNPKFLNDLAADAEGNLYLSDMLADAIHKIDLKTNQVTLIKSGEELGNPNGLLINPKSKNLIVVTWTSGKILEINTAGVVEVLKESLAGLDGVDYDNEGNLFVSSFQKGEIYKIPNYGRGEIMTFLNALTTPADISVDREKSELLIPSFDANTVSSVSLKKQS